MPLSENQLAKMKQKRDKVLEQAILLFSEQGYNDTTIAKVAKASGVSFGSVFTYFPTKEELFHCAVIDPLSEISKSLLDFDPDTNTPLLELERMIKHHIKIFSNLGIYLRLVVQVIGQNNRFQDQFKELDEFHMQFREKIVKLVINGQKNGQLHEYKPIFAATAYTSLLMGLRLNHTDSPDKELWEQFVPYALQLFRPKQK
ncbi:TetR/AcrR family transcriptional regulator [Bacillus salitolerans]|uniref:TetR/AcrR family transcriptional regulator n=1 Tax=Bacillus salitolerans TaxID=1437434 RepID=A0ABW4LQQ7_9BACI